MKVKIVNVSPFVITFNKIPLVLRGKETANNVEITDDDQRREVLMAESRRLVKIEWTKELPMVNDAPDGENNVNEDDVADKDDDFIDEEVLSNGNNADKVKAQGDESKDNINTETNKDHKEADKDQSKKDIVTTARISKKRNGKGRPKGSKNKVKRVSRSNKISPIEENEKVIVGSANGSFETKMVHSYAETEENSETVRASLGAMDELLKEENKSEDVIDEKTLEVQDRAGGTAYISTGESVKGIGIVNSVLPESDAIKNRDPFIDRDNELNKDNKDAFLNDEASNKDDDDLFLEI